VTDFFFILLDRCSSYCQTEFWENWYVIGENDALDETTKAVVAQTGLSSNEEFKFVFYNGKTRQNTYEGAFIYSRTKELGPKAMAKVYQIADEAGMQPKNFCKIRNGCFADDVDLPTSTTNPSNGKGLNKNQSPSTTPGVFRGILASTKISELLGVDSVAAANVEPMMLKRVRAAEELDIRARFQDEMNNIKSMKRQWWFEVGDYLENPHRHFELMDSMRQTVDWPEDIVNGASTR
jgi:hypothetical protein